MAPSLATRKHSRPGRTDKRASAVCFCCGFVPVRQNNKEKTLFRRSVWVSDVVDVYDRKKRERREIARAHREMHKMPPRESRGSSSSQSRSQLFSLAKKNYNNNARYYKTTKQKIEQREENDESSSHHRPLTSKLFALNPFDAGVANVINDDVFSPET